MFGYKGGADNPPPHDIYQRFVECLPLCLFRLQYAKSSLYAKNDWILIEITTYILTEMHICGCW